MFTLLICGLLFFRWPLLERFVGTIRMYLFDAILFTIIAASNIGHPGSWPWLGYTIGGLCTLLAFTSAQKYLKYSEIQRIENEQGKPKSDTTE